MSRGDLAYMWIVVRAWVFGLRASHDNGIVTSCYDDIFECLQGRSRRSVRQFSILQMSQSFHSFSLRKSVTIGITKVWQRQSAMEKRRAHRGCGSIFSTCTSLQLPLTPHINKRRNNNGIKNKARTFALPASRTFLRQLSM